MRRGTRLLRFGPVRQEVGSKHVQEGTLLEAINVRQTAKAGVYAKRRGFARTAQTFSGGSLSGSPESLLPGVNGNSLMRDSGGQLWSRQSATNTWYYSGKQARIWPTTTAVQTGLYTTPQPFSCMVGSFLWTFALVTNGYEFSIVNPATNQVTTAKIAVTATGITHASAAYDGNYVWVFWVANASANGRVNCHKINPASPSTTPTATVYYTFPSSPVNLSTLPVYQVHAKYMAAANAVFVVACGGAGAIGAMHSVLDPATGLAVAVGGQAASTSIASATGGSGNQPLSALYILDGQDGSGTYWYYTLSGRIDTSGSGKVGIVKVRTSTFSAYAVSGTAHPSGSSVYAYSSAGVNDSANDVQYVAVTTYLNGVLGWGDTSNTYGTLLFSCTSGGLLASSTNGIADAYASDWIASGFAQVNGRWFATMGFDDYGLAPTTFGAETSTLQRMYHVFELVMGGSPSFTLAAQYDAGQGSALFHRASSNLAIPPVPLLLPSVPPAHVVGTKIYAVQTVASSITGYVDLACATIDVAKAYGKDCQLGSRGYSPGNIPMTWNGSLTGHPIAPLIFPFCVKHVAGTGTDYSIAAFVFAYYDSDGTVWRSAPFILSTTIGHGAILRIPIPNFLRFGAILAGVEFYIGNNATPKLQTVLPITTASNFVSYTTPAVASMVNGETLYTTGNAPSNAWPIPCQAVGTWRNRVFLAQANTLFPSFELETSKGPMFNESQLSIWADETADITAIAPVDWNYLALMSEGQTAVVGGDGPNGIGVGNYVIRTLPSMTGVAAGGVAIQGAMGCYYQNKQTGRLMCVTSDLQVTECAGGAYDYASYLVTAAAWYEPENLMVFFAPASNAAIVIDYQHMSEVAPFGQVYLWTFASTFAPSAATRDSVGLIALSSTTGNVYRTLASQWVDDNAGGADTYQMKLATAELQLAGIQGSFSLEKVQALLTMHSASGVSLGVYPGYASPTLSDPDVSTVSIDLPAPTNDGDTESVLTRPPNCARIESFRLVVQEKAGVTGQSFEFEGFGVEFTQQGGMWRPVEGRIV